MVAVPEAGRRRPVRARVGVRACAWSLVAALALGTIAPSGAAPPAPLADQFADTWTTRDGLPHSTVNVIQQTRDGFMWFATWDGLARFDGQEFRVFHRDEVPGLGDDGIRAMHVGPSGDLWVGSARGGVVRWKDDRWQAYATAPGLVTDLLELADRRLWIATVRDGLVRIDPDGHRVAVSTAQGLPSNATTALARDPSGTVWVATNGGLARIDGDRAVPVAGMPDDPVLSVLALPDGRLVAGTENGAVIGRPGHFAPLHPDLHGKAVIRVWQDPDGTLWLGTVSSGVLRLADGRLDTLDVDHGLPNNRVLALLRGREGSLWIGTNGGLVRLREAPIRTFTRGDGLSDDFVRTVLVGRDGQLWVGTSKGLDRIDPSTGRIEPIAALGDASVLALAQDRSGDIYVGTFHDGVVQLRGDRVVATITTREGLPSNEVRAVLPARDGRLWIGTKLGALVRDGATSRVVDARDGLPGEYVQSLYEDRDGAVWIGTGSGLGVVRGTQARAIDLSHVDAQYIYGFLDTGDPRAFWSCTDRGLVRVDRATGRLAIVGRAQGLPFDKIFAAVPDRAGNVWLTGNDGIARARLADVIAAADGRLRHVDVRLFGHSDGMLTAQANGGSMPAAGIDGQGRLWVATALGVARMDPTAASRTPPPLPPVAIERFDVDGRELLPRAGLELPAGSRRVGVQFVTPTMLNARRVQYRYRLEGLGSEWVDLGAQREVQFANLAPGAYVLHVRASVPGEPRLSATADLPFAIAAHWWQRPMMWLLLGLAAGALLGGAYRARMRRVRANERRLRELVEQRTDALQVQTRIAERLARTDALTALANRRALDEALAQGVFDAGDRVVPVCLLLVDVDRFKPINDHYSHAAGDLALRAVAEILQSQSRQDDIAARWGGDEFALLLVDCTLEQAQVVAERVRSRVEAIDCEPFAPGLRLSASIGIARGDTPAAFSTLIARADAALYRAKHEGRNRVCASAD